jgi:hypothetical protein
MKTFLVNSVRFIFPSQKRRDMTSWPQAEQNVTAALRVLVITAALDQPGQFLRMSEESVRQSFLRPTQHIAVICADCEATDK